MMFCIQNLSTDPYFNLAAEEYLLKHVADDCFMLWRNTPAIIIGKHQNAYAEINVAYVAQRNIPVIRRLSGGGAVFHDLGNLNFTMTSTNKEQSAVNYRKFTLPVLETMQKLGVNAQLDGTSNLTIAGKKFSGNAEYLYKQRILHHGTLLFSTHLPDLKAALRVHPLTYSGHAVQSIRASVTNISDHLRQSLDIAAFAELLMRDMFERHPDAARSEFSAADIQAIHALREQKYLTWNWNIGMSPPYTLRKTGMVNAEPIEVLLAVRNGMIREINFSAEHFSQPALTAIENALRNTPHDHNAVRETLQSSVNMANISQNELITALF